jgi:hypothetical protein
MKDPTTAPGLATRAASTVALAALMILGVLVLGRLASSDVMAIVLTTAFFAAVAGVLLLVARQHRGLLISLVAAFVLVAGTSGVVLGAPLVFDDIVAEDVIEVPQASAADAAPDTTDDRAEDQAAAGSQATAAQIAAGQFADRNHPGSGTATLIDTGTGDTVLTLTDFATDNGPDLFVYLVPAESAAGTVDGAIDLGRLKGNVGEQQYDVPAGADAGDGWRVVVWCRAFAVTFTEATLQA